MLATGVVYLVTNVQQLNTSFTQDQANTFM